MKQKQFRLEEYQIIKLKAYADKHRMTETEVIRACIENLGAATQCVAPDQSEIVTELQKQVEEKRQEVQQLRGLLEKVTSEAIEERARHAEAMAQERKAREDKENRLLNALTASQEQTHAAQALHAAEKKETMALESTEQKKTRWQRLKEAWRG